MELNPYASPLEPSAPDPFAAIGVGVWADRNSFVVHKEATLPPICLKTGRQAECVVPVRFGQGFYFINRRKLTLHVPLSRTWAWRQQKLPGPFFVAAVVPFVALPLGFVLVVALDLNLQWDGFGLLVLGGAVMSGVCFLCALSFRNLVVLLKVRGDYFWFAGANHRFLAQLPTWPGK